MEAWFLCLCLGAGSEHNVRRQRVAVGGSEYRLDPRLPVDPFDVFENLGLMEPREDPVEDLASRVGEIVRYPSHQVSESIEEWVSKGLLKYDLKSGHLVWS